MKLRYTIEEAAEQMSVSRRRLYDMIAHQEIPVSRIGRSVGILHDDLVTLLEASREGEKRQPGVWPHDAATTKARSTNAKQISDG